MDGQLTELLTNYGPIGGIWFDGMWDKPNADWHLDKTYALIHKLQPAALIIPNHHQTPRPGEDVQTFERDLPGQNTAGFNTKYVSSQLPLESSDTLNENWGFNIGDSKYKSAAELERRLVRAAGNNSNLLMNIGPYPNGEIDPQFVSRLHAVGEWMSKYGDSIYNTRGGPNRARRLGSHHAEGKQDLCSRPELERPHAGARTPTAKDHRGPHAGREFPSRIQAEYRRRNPESSTAKGSRNRPSHRTNHKHVGKSGAGKPA